MRLSKHRDSLLAETEKTPFRAYLKHSLAELFPSPLPPDFNTRLLGSSLNH